MCANVTQAVNTLTQRMLFPACHATVHVDAGGLRDGDIAGFVALAGCYGMIGLKKHDGQYSLVLLAKPAQNATVFGDGGAEKPGVELARIPFEAPEATFKIGAEFGEKHDLIWFYYHKDEQWIQLGPAHEVFFKMDHFTGCRFALSVFSMQSPGGYADFSAFRYNEQEA